MSETQRRDVGDKVREHDFPPPVFYVLYEVGAGDALKGGESPQDWYVPYCRLVDVPFGFAYELLSDNPPAYEKLITANAGRCLIIIVESVGYPAERKPTTNFDRGGNKLWALIANSLAGGPPENSRGEILTAPEESSQSGQLLATVVLTEDVKSAKAYRDKLKSGEVRLKHPKIAPLSRQEEIKLLLDREPSPDYGSVYANVKKIWDLTKIEMAERLAGTLNEKLKHSRTSTYNDKKFISKWVNDQLRQVGLAIKCPKTGRPGILVADAAPRPEEGRFRLQTSFEDGSRSVTVSHIDLWPLELMPDEPRQESFLLHQDRIAASKKNLER